MVRERHRGAARCSCRGTRRDVLEVLGLRVRMYMVGCKHGVHAWYDVCCRGTAKGKRVQANLAAKNHAVILPDADKESTLNQLTGGWGSACGWKLGLIQCM